MTKCNCGDYDFQQDYKIAKDEYESIFKESGEKIDKLKELQKICLEKIDILKDVQNRLDTLEQQNHHNHNGCWNCPHIRKRYCNYNSLVLCEFDMCSQNCPYYPGTYVPYGAGTVTWL